MKEEKSEESSKPSLARRMLDFIKNTLYFWYIQYELITCIYIFEPWEKLLLNSSILTICVLVGYSSYVYLPSYLYSLINEGKRIMLNI